MMVQTIDLRTNDISNNFHSNQFSIEYKVMTATSNIRVIKQKEWARKRIKFLWHSMFVRIGSDCKHRAASYCIYPISNDSYPDYISIYRKKCVISGIHKIVICHTLNFSPHLCLFLSVLCRFRFIEAREKKKTANKW